MAEGGQSTLADARHEGFVTVAEAGLQGMVTLRGDFGAAPIARAIQLATGCDVPAQRRVTRADDTAVAWMSPDELLIIVPHQKAKALVKTLSQALAGEFATVANVSDARTVFKITGTHWRDALAKLCPVDFSTLTEGDIRRTRAAQVAAAIWVSGPDEATLVCFRSVAQYMFDLLSGASAPGSEPALYR